MTKSLGNKRQELKQTHIDKIYQLFDTFEDNKYSKIFDNDDFGYTQIQTQQPKLDDAGNSILKKGKPEADTSKNDKENIPLKMDIQAYFEREVLPFAPDAFYTMDTAKVGYEINFNKYFYEYTPPRELADIVKDILALEAETDGVLKGIIKE